MFDLKIPLLLFVGLFGIISINLKYQEDKKQPPAFLNKNKKEELNLYITQGGFLCLNPTKPPKLIDIGSTFFQKLEGEYIEQDVVLEKHDIYYDIYNSLSNREKNDSKTVSISFEVIDEYKDIEVLKSSKHEQSESVFLNNADIFVFREHDHIGKIKIQSKAPFLFEDKSIREFKSYLFNSSDSIIQNAEIKYGIDSSEYKLLIRAVYKY